MTGDAEGEGQVCGISGVNLMLRGSARQGSAVAYLRDADCKTHRLQVRFSRAAETLAVVRDFEDCCAAIAAPREVRVGPTAPTRLEDIAS